MPVIHIERKVLEKNEQLAQANRELFAERGIFTLNMVSSPGAGKTTILEQTLERLRGKLPVAVIEGDLQTDLDAQRVARYEVPVAQIVTHGACHLEARLVRDALEQLELDGIRLLVIENVGNLVCPASFDLGETHKVVVISTPEGDDKPLKYPAMFRNASLLLLNKLDLVPYVGCDLERLEANALSINPQLRVFRMSARSGEGLDAWCDWLLGQTGARSE